MVNIDAFYPSIFVYSAGFVLFIEHRFTNEMLSRGILSLYSTQSAKIKNITPLRTYLFMNLDVMFNGIVRGFKQLFNGQ